MDFDNIFRYLRPLHNYKGGGEEGVPWLLMHMPSLHTYLNYYNYPPMQESRNVIPTYAKNAMLDNQKPAPWTTKQEPNVTLCVQIIFRIAVSFTCHRANLGSISCTTNICNQIICTEC